MRGGLELSLNSQSVVIRNFNNADIPRVPIQVAGLTYSSAGTPVGTGVAYEYKHLWDVTCRLEIAEAYELKALYGMFEYRRREKLDANILIIDTTDRYEEYGSRSRAIAPGTTDVVNGYMHLYFAQFKGWFTAAPKFSGNGRYRQCTFQLTETDKVPAS